MSKITLTVDLDGDWRKYWGSYELPHGATAIGVVTRESSKTHLVGALLRSPSGMYVQGNDGFTKGIDNYAVSDVLKEI